MSRVLCRGLKDRSLWCSAIQRVLSHHVRIFGCLKQMSGAIPELANFAGLVVAAPGCGSCLHGSCVQSSNGTAHCQCSTGYQGSSCNQQTGELWISCWASSSQAIMLFASFWTVRWTWMNLWFILHSSVLIHASQWWSLLLNQCLFCKSRYMISTHLQERMLDPCWTICKSLIDLRSTTCT